TRSGRRHLHGCGHRHRGSRRHLPHECGRGSRDRSAHRHACADRHRPRRHGRGARRNGWPADDHSADVPGRRRRGRRRARPDLVGVTVPIDTFIAGNPTDIRRGEDWIRTTLGTTIGNVAAAAARARRIADDAWDGDASETYLDRSSEHVLAIEDFHERTSRTADVFAGLAGELSRALSDMADIRARAAAAGLPVVCNTISDPPPGDDEAAFRRTSAYQEASDAAEAVHARWSVAVATATNTWTGHPWSASFLVSTALDYVDKNLQGRIADLLTMQQHL